MTTPPRAHASLVARLLMLPIRAWRLVSVHLPPRCRFSPSCSQYALDAVRTYGLTRGSILAGWRLLRCNPWSHGGVDYAQEQRLFRGRPA